MLNNPVNLDRIFQALADPTRRGMLERLGRASATVSELAAPIAISLAAVVQHVQILEASGLVHRHVRDTVPPEVDYSLTTLGKRMIEPIEMVYDWARTNAASLDELKPRQTSRRR